MRRAAYFALALLAASFDAVGEGPGPQTLPWESDAKALLDGVGEITAPGVPGTIAVWGKEAFPVVVGGAAVETRLPVVAAARMGRGRVVAFAHNGYGSAETIRHAGTARLLVNAVRWAGGAKGKPRVGLFGGELADLLAKQEGLETATIDNSADWKHLDKFDVLCCFGSDLDADAVKAVQRFVIGGGGLVAGLCPWGWMQVTGAVSLRSNPLNRVVASAGLAWADGYSEKTSAAGYEAKTPPTRLTHGGLAISALIDSASPGNPLAEPEAKQAGVAAISAARALPPEEKDLLVILDALLEKRREHLAPDDAHPLRAEAALDRFLLAWQDEKTSALPAAQVKPHPAASTFPGDVPASAKPVDRAVEIDTAVPDWHSTGLYAVPGKLLTVAIPDAVVRGGLRVRIGCHTDELWGLDEWHRVPAISREWPLDGPRTSVASPFGGLVYVVVPGGESKAGRVTVRIGGAVEAPLFVRGETTAKEWKAIRERPGPWAELATSKVILSAPSSCVRGLDDPGPLLDFWDGVLDAAADLATIPHERPRPERYVADVQIGAGYMHSGYPIMTHLDAAPRMVDLDLLRTKGDWGLFHELGHNHQEGEWTFDGTGEVTNNLWSLYLMETCSGVATADGHEALKDRTTKAKEYVKRGAKFAEWKEDPFLALTMYVQLQEGFGWAAFKKVFAEYRALPGKERPKDDGEKLDQWMVRFSRAIGRDLGPFFESWGVPVSKSARDSIETLPDWMPEGWGAE